MNEEVLIKLCKLDEGVYLCSKEAIQNHYSFITMNIMIIGFIILTSLFIIGVMKNE